MPNWSALSASTSFCVALIMASAIVAQEREGLIILHPGMQFTTAFTNDFGADAETLMTVTSVTGSTVSIEDSSSRGVSVRRELLVSDRHKRHKVTTNGAQ